MKYFKSVTITFTNNKSIHTNIFSISRKIKQCYRIGGALYGYGIIKSVDIKVNKTYLEDLRAKNKMVESRRRYNNA